MRILKLSPDRWVEYKELRLEALRNEPLAFGASYARTGERPDAWWIGHLEAAQRDATKTLLFAEEDGCLVGMAGAYPEDDPANVDVVSMYVRPSLRRRGIARALLEALVAGVQGREIRLCVNGDQKPAVELYKSFGFVTIAETKLKREDGSEYIQLYMSLGERHIFPEAE